MMGHNLDIRNCSVVVSDFQLWKHVSHFGDILNLFLTGSCGYCGYALNLSSTMRNTADIGSKYGKQIRKGVVSFFTIDESRFTQTDELRCMPYFHSSRSWGFIRNRTRLLCRKCSGHIGSAYEDEDSTSCQGSDDLDMSSKGSSTSTRKIYVIKINALQPSSDDDSSALFSAWWQSEFWTAAMYDFSSLLNCKQIKCRTKKCSILSRPFYRGICYLCSVSVIFLLILYYSSSISLLQHSSSVKCTSWQD